MDDNLMLISYGDKQNYSFQWVQSMDSSEDNGVHIIQPFVRSFGVLIFLPSQLLQGLILINLSLLQAHLLKSTLTMQGQAGIRQSAINLYTSTMMIHTITPFVDYNNWLKRLDIKLNEPTNQNLIKAAKSTIKKTLGTSLINNPMTPPSLRARSD